MEDNEEKDDLLSMIRLSEENISRFRSISRRGNVITITTRTGSPGATMLYESPFKRARFLRKEIETDFKCKCIQCKRLKPPRKIKPWYEKFESDSPNIKTCYYTYWGAENIKRAKICPLRKEFKKFLKKEIKKWNEPIYDPDGPWTNKLRRNPYFIKDYDDDFDTSYRHFEFEVPSKYRMTDDEVKEASQYLTPWEVRTAILQNMKAELKGMTKTPPSQ